MASNEVRGYVAEVLERDIEAGRNVTYLPVGLKGYDEEQLRQAALQELKIRGMDGVVTTCQSVEVHYAERKREEMSIKVMMSYPDAMRREIERRGMEWWAKGGEFESFNKAVEEAKRISEEKNFPIQLKCFGQKLTVYPRGIDY